MRMTIGTLYNIADQMDELNIPHDLEFSIEQVDGPVGFTYEIEGLEVFYPKGYTFITTDE